jgi:hypothetical protein
MTMYLKTKTGWLKGRLPVQRPVCPVCSTIRRIALRRGQDYPEDGYVASYIARGNHYGVCRRCHTLFDTENRKHQLTTQWRYVAKSLGELVREQLASWWLSSHETPLPELLEVPK